LKTLTALALAAVLYSCPEVLEPDPGYSVTYSAPDSHTGSAPRDNSSYLAGEDVVVKGPSDLDRPGYYFYRWLLVIDGQETLLHPGESFSMPNNHVKLTAQWTLLVPRKVYYSSGTAESGAAPVDSFTYFFGDEVTVMGNPGGLRKPQQASISWQVQDAPEGTIYDYEQTFTMPDHDVHLIPHWVPGYTVHYVASGADIGTTYEVDYPLYTSFAIEQNPNNLSKFGFNLAGWHRFSNEYETQYEAGDWFPGDRYNIWLYPVWTLTPHQQVYPSDGQEGDEFGTAIATTDDWLFISAPMEDGGEGDPVSALGAVYAYSKGPSGWEEELIIRPEQTTDSMHFGRSLALTGDWLFVGAPRSDSFFELTRTSSGEVFIYKKGAVDWELFQRLELPIGQDNSSEASYSYFGQSLDAENNLLVVGAPGIDDRSDRIDKGSAFSFLFDGDQWVFEDELLPRFSTSSTKVKDYGRTIQLDGDFLMITSLEETSYGPGYTYVFKRWDSPYTSGSAIAWDYSTRLKAEDFDLWDKNGYASALYQGEYIVSAPGHRNREGGNSGTVHFTN
jgi:hypothetical protein